MGCERSKAQYQPSRLGIDYGETSGRWRGTPLLPVPCLGVVPAPAHDADGRGYSSGI